jgi:hypothetical protein
MPVYPGAFPISADPGAGRPSSDYPHGDMLITRFGAIPVAATLASRLPINWAALVT